MSPQREFPYLTIDEYFSFPEPEKASRGIVARGGNLSPGMLRSAYVQGIFPWYNKDEPVLWWSPSPRFVLFPEELHISGSLKRMLHKKTFSYTMDTDFEKVIHSCAKVPRPGQGGTWITPELLEAYILFHKLGYAHSFEAWKDGKLAGGFYGVLMGQVFFGESMFTIEPDASKCAFCQFVKAFSHCGGKLIDSQVYTDHLARFGGKNISREVFLRLEQDYLPQKLSGDLRSNFEQGQGAVNL